MNLVSQYVIKVAAFLFFSLMLEGILPMGSSRKIVRLMISLVFMYVLVQPLIGWLQQKIPLEQLTLVDYSWQEAAQLEKEYETQAEMMVGQGYAAALMEAGLPKKLAEQYQIVEIEVEDTVEVLLSRNDPIGSLTDRSLQLGQIGSSAAEEEAILDSLSEFWGIPRSSLEMRLR